MDAHVRKINRNLMLGYIAIALILLIAYVVEVIIGHKSINYFLWFATIDLLPMFVSIGVYESDKKSNKLKYFVVGGFLILYAYSLFLAETTMVFAYILPMLFLMILYHDKWLVIGTSAITIALNAISLIFDLHEWKIKDGDIRDIEIQIGVLATSIIAAYMATALYSEIHSKNMEYTETLHNKNEEISKMTMQTITTIANTIDAKDEYTRGHSRRVSEYAAAIAEHMGLPEREVTDIKAIGLLHDIGKIGIPDAVLNKPSRLTNEEYQLMKNHTVIGAEILKDINIIENLDVGTKYHHERFDGRGYPDGLKGEEIPLIARIIAVADAYDAMTSNRVYRKRLEKEAVLKELRDGRNTQWDEQCVNALLSLISRGKLPLVDDEADDNMVKQTTKILTRVIDIAGGQTPGDMDTLTGVYGRDSGKSEMQNRIEKIGKGCILLFDVDDFRGINDRYGFVTGDLCLKELVNAIQKVFHSSITTRLGADEFIVYSSLCLTASDAEKHIEKLFKILSKELKRKLVVDEMHVSVGVAEICTEKDKVMVLYEHASKALYVAKQTKGDSYYCYHTEYNEKNKNYNVIEDIDNLVDIIKNNTTVAKATNLERDYIKDIIATIMLLNQESGTIDKLAMVTLKAVSGTKASAETLENVMNILQKAIVDNLKEGSKAARYSSSQYLIIFNETDKNKIEATMHKIMTEFLRVYTEYEYEVHYKIASVGNNDVTKRKT